MKKTFLLVLALTFSAFCADAAFIYPGSYCTDKARLAACLATAETVSQRFLVTALIALADKTPATFAEFCSMMDEVGKKVNFSSEAARSRTVTLYKKQLVLRRTNLNRFFADALSFAAQNPCRFDIFFYDGNALARKNLTPIQRYNAIIRNLIKYNYSPNHTKKFVTSLIELAVGLENIDVKADLNKLNRLFSAKLAADPTAWTPVVQLIRTALSTY